MKDAGKTIAIFSAILIMMIFANVSIENKFTINEEAAKAPVYALATLGGLGNVAGGIIEEATNLIKTINEEVNYIDINGLPLRFLSGETKEYLNLPYEEYEKKVFELWEKVPWWKEAWYSIGTLGAPMNIKKYWQEHQNQ